MTNAERDSMIREIHKLLVGNGEEGICDAVRNHTKYIKWMWWVLGALFLGSGGSAALNAKTLGEVLAKLGGM